MTVAKSRGAKSKTPEPRYTTEDLNTATRAIHRVQSGFTLNNCECEARSLLMAHYVVYRTQDNFTVCVLLHRTYHTVSAVGVAKRDPCDLDNPARARTIALSRAVRMFIKSGVD